MTELSLPETVIALQRLDLIPEARQVVEEAARLLEDGREIEARALVEKAEALAANGNGKPNGIANGNGKGNGNGNGHGNGNGNGGGKGDNWPGVMIAPIAEKLATGFTAVLTGVLEDIYHHTGDQVQVVASVLEERIHGIEEALQKNTDVEERLEQLGAEQQALRQAHGETAGTVEAIGAGLESRIAAVEERVTGIDQMVRDLQPQVSSVLTRLDRHTDALRALEQRHAQRVSALNQVLDQLGRLREEEPAPENSLPLQ